MPDRANEPSIFKALDELYIPGRTTDPSIFKASDERHIPGRVGEPFILKSWTIPNRINEPSILILDEPYILNGIAKSLSWQSGKVLEARLTPSKPLQAFPSFSRLF